MLTEKTDLAAPPSSTASSSVTPSSVTSSATPPSATPASSMSPGAASRIRDHLANERTYLAWMRTSIALMGFGIVIARLRSLLAAGTTGTGQGRFFGLIFTIIGLFTILISTQHYFSVRNSIEQANYQPRSMPILIFSSMLFCLGGGVIFLILSIT